MNVNFYIVEVGEMIVILIVEIKNMNSFCVVEWVIEYEVV